MRSSSLLLLGGAALAAAQAPPAPVRLTATKSSVLPVLPTNFQGVDTLEGAIINSGPQNPGFTGLNGNATIQQNNAGITYQAILPPTNFANLTGSNITGSIRAQVPANGTGVMFSVNFQGFPASLGPFVYHIHGLPVPADGNCTATMGHLDTTNRGEYYPCIPAHPETCQVGDLSGKHGNFSGTSYVANYSELYLSTNPDNSYFGFAGSIVIHSMNKTRLTCANFTLASAGTASNYTNGTFSSAVSSIASGLNAAATAAANSSANATRTASTTGASSTAQSSGSGVAGAGGAGSTGAATPTTTRASASAATTAPVSTGNAAVKNAVGAVLGGVAFIAGVMAM